ncbi:sushi, von Willebrand factor type A, EGF and pentraxin domain-containing protein 1, partial [Austrofundulus limnaeus]|uniref:Sushi, von Willebrand factor type A, EGF and pentraxin domain-containing protein 1 n=1 Tax=Austrofundulus limnaeus TaxID=52670 RepID=A0A2I4BWW1_AUSLI
MHGGSATCVDNNWIKTVECPALSCEVGALATHLKIKGFPPKDNRATAGQKLKFFCPEAYDVEGSEETECLETGQWRDPFPTCSEKCSTPEMPDGLLLTQSGVFYWSKGESVTFKCRGRGYFIEGNEKMECLGNGQWSGVLSTCEKKCQIPTLTENVLIHPPVEGHAVRTGHTITFACRHAWLSIHGNSKIQCLEDGQWNGPPPTCEGSVCGEPPPLENGDTVEINKPEYETNERVEYRCQDRYLIQGGP